MNINISEKPIIAMDTGKIVGTLKGLIYEDRQVTSLYCKIEEQYIYIPIKDACVGADGIMLKTAVTLPLIPSHPAKRVYTENGGEVGTVSSIETDNDFQIQGIYVEDLFIRVEDILQMGDVIIIRSDENIINKVLDDELFVEVQEESIIDTGSELPALPITEKIARSKEEVVCTGEAVSVDEMELKEEAIEAKIEEFELNEEEIEVNNEEVEDQEVEVSNEEVLNKEEEIPDEIFPTEEPINDITIEIDPRYNHLCGKRLLENITILKETYPKGSIIDAPLIQFAINNNAIVKLIMNTED